MEYFVSNGYWILNVNGKHYAVDKTSDKSFVLRKKDKICLNDFTFTPVFAPGKAYYESLIGHRLDGFICRDIIKAVGGIEMDGGAVAIGQLPLVA